MGNFKNLKLEDINKRIEELNNKKKLSINEKVELKKLQKERDKSISPVESSGVFVSKEDSDKNRAIFIDIEKIVMPEFNDRSGIDKEKLDKLSKSIKKHGLLQPISVRKNSDGTYTKIFGKRRIEAHKLLGEDRIKAFVYEGNDSLYDLKMVILHENEIREDLNMYDKVRVVLELISDKIDIDFNSAKALCNKIKNIKKYKDLDDKFYENKDTVEAILRDSLIFTSISNLVNSFPVLDMNDTLVDALTKNKLTFGVAKVLNAFDISNLNDDISFEDVLGRVIEEGYSITETKKYLSTLIVKKEKVKTVFENNIKDITKIYKQLDKEKQLEFEKALEELKSRFS